jgi:hypothetical protein
MTDQGYQMMMTATEGFWAVVGGSVIMLLRINRGGNGKIYE